MKQTKSKQPSNPSKNPIRQLCNCQASVHSLINNCTSCGKIVCEKENEGPCLFCGNLVFRRPKAGQQQNVNSAFVDNSEDPDFKKAEDLKNRLLQYDASQIAETNIIDESTDWFEINENVWSSKQAKELASKKIEEETAQKDEINKATYISFDGSSFVEEKKTFDYDKSKKEVQQFYIDNQQKDKENQEKAISKKSQNITNSELKGDEKLCNESREIFDGVKKEFAEKYKAHIERKEKNKSEQHRKKLEEKIDTLRRTFNQDDNYDNFLAIIEDIVPEINPTFYDEELFSLSADKGKCLSMLQPWASLLIEGFKRFEGRFWNTEYRGPLWIHAGSTPPTPETLKFVENEYAEFYKNAEKKPNFPERYPLGSLLGLVDLQTVLKKDTYNEVIPKEFRENSMSEHVFVVRNPRKLLYPIKMPGSKDIYDLHPEIRKVALKCLKKVRIDWWEYYAKKLNNVMYEKDEVVKKEEVVQESNESLEERKGTVVEEKNEVREEKMTTKIWKNKNFQKKKEKFGLSVHEFFDEENLREIVDYLEEKAWEMNNMTNKNVAIINFELSFPFYEQMIELFAGQKKNLKIKTMKCGHFYINKKQKAFEFDTKFKILLNIGGNVSMTLVNEEMDETYQFDLPGGSLYFVGEKCKVSFQNVFDNTGGKKKMLKGDCTNLFVLFSEGA